MNNKVYGPRTQALKDKHGTPEEFEEAVWKACDNLMVTPAEAKTGIGKYKGEWTVARFYDQLNEAADKKAKVNEVVEETPVVLPAGDNL